MMKYATIEKSEKFIETQKTSVNTDTMNRKYNIKQVLKMRDEEQKYKLIAAMKDELKKHLITHKSLIPINRNDINEQEEIVRSVTILHNKVNTLGEHIKSKARLCLRGDLQNRREDDPYIASPTASTTTTMIIIAIIANMQIKMTTMDVSTAYLNAK